MKLFSADFVPNRDKLYLTNGELNEVQDIWITIVPGAVPAAPGAPAPAGPAIGPPLAIRIESRVHGVVIIHP